MSDYRITLLPSGREFLASGTTTLLQAALDAGINLPYGCRNGVCGSCKSTLRAGQIDIDEKLLEAFSVEERKANKTLPCCARPLSDITLECREVNVLKDIPVKILPCRVQRMERLAEDVMILHLKLPSNERLQFLAGQYIEFLLKDGKRRAFSIANAPHDDALLQVHIRRVDNGEFTNHVFTQMKEKDILRFQGPYGSFHLRDESPKPLIFLAGGTGFAPIKSLVEDMGHKKGKRPATLYWGARNREGLYQHDLPSHWAAESQLTYIPVLSEASPSDQWSGRSGLVHQAVLDDFADLSGFQVYACGSPAMIAAARDSFIPRGLAEDDFIFDSFTFAVDS